MYPSVRPAAVLDAAPRSDPSDGPSSGVSANVVALGFTSFFTDVSSEMVTTVLPIYLVFQLGLSQFEFGLFNGIYFGISGLMSVVGGVIADRRQRYKEVAGAGYAVSAGAKLGLLAAGNAAVPASAMLFSDRVGKGVRIAPRDTLDLAQLDAGAARHFVRCAPRARHGRRDRGPDHRIPHLASRAGGL